MPDTNGNIASANISELDALGETGAPQVQPAKPQFEVGSYVTFGRNPQNNGDTIEPIEWLVLDNDGNTALLLSKYGLDGMPLYDEFINESGVIGWILCEGWHDSQVRQWLNDDFYSRAFNTEEQE
ncbi:MAG: DUF6273 domain-containing protein [bacterium]|nr:DUF6273 domain-containing protein [bacterium]